MMRCDGKTLHHESSRAAQTRAGGRRRDATYETEIRRFRLPLREAASSSSLWESLSSSGWVRPLSEAPEGDRSLSSGLLCMSPGPGETAPADSRLDQGPRPGQDAAGRSERAATEARIRDKGERRGREKEARSRMSWPRASDRFWC